MSKKIRFALAILSYPQKHDISANGGAVGTLKHLPPTLSLQYHFTDLGLSLQAGVDYAIDKTWSVNCDVKKVQIRTDLKSAAGTLGTVKIDPLLIGVGVGYKF